MKEQREKLEFYSGLQFIPVGVYLQSYKLIDWSSQNGNLSNLHFVIFCVTEALFNIFLKLEWIS